MPRPITALRAAPRQQRSQATLHALLAAAERLLARQHFEDISIHQILAESGVSTGSFYARFRRKDDLLPHLYQQYSADLRTRLAAQTNPECWAGLALQPRIRALVGEAITAYRQRRGLLRAVALLARSRPKALARSVWRERDDQYGAAAALLLACRAEIRHPDPELAVQLGLLFVLATCRDKILFAEAPHPASVHIDDERLGEELARALHAYLTLGPPHSK